MPPNLRSLSSLSLLVGAACAPARTFVPAPTYGAPGAPTSSSGAATAPDSGPPTRTNFVHAGPGLVQVAHDAWIVQTERTRNGTWIARRDTSYHEGVAGIAVRTATGTFAVRTDSSAAAAWADSAAALGAPVPVAGVADAPTSYRLSGVMLARVNSTTVMRLLRLRTPEGDSLPAYRLDATNSVWDGSLRLDGRQARSLFDALRGTAPTSADDADRPFNAFEVDTVAILLDGSRPEYPAEVAREKRSGSITFVFVVGTDGRAEPASLQLLGDPDPALALAVRKSVLSYRFRPAVRGGAAVRQIMQHRFEFETR